MCLLIPFGVSSSFVMNVHLNIDSFPLLSSPWRFCQIKLRLAYQCQLTFYYSNHAAFFSFPLPLSTIFLFLCFLLRNSQLINILYLIRFTFGRTTYIYYICEYLFRCCSYRLLYVYNRVHLNVYKNIYMYMFVANDFYTNICLPIGMNHMCTC